MINRAVSEPDQKPSINLYQRFRDSDLVEEILQELGRQECARPDWPTSHFGQAQEVTMVENLIDTAMGMEHGEFTLTEFRQQALVVASTAIRLVLELEAK